MRVLVGCERSGVVAQAFRDAGHDAWSCDVVPSDICRDPDHVKGAGDCCGHFIGDVREHLYEGAWDLGIFFPPCTFLCSSGLHWNKRRPGREAKTREALAFARLLLNAPIPRVALENPIGRIGTAIRKADQTIQPWQFGHNASKATQLWLRNLPPLRPTKIVKPRMVNGRPRWANQTDSGQNRLGPSEDRAIIRGKTYQGIADAMAAQWGALDREHDGQGLVSDCHA